MLLSLTRLFVGMNDDVVEDVIVFHPMQIVSDLAVFVFYLSLLPLLL